MCTALERMLPRLVNLSTTFSFCPFTVMVDSLYGFPGAGWCTTSVFWADCEGHVIRMPDERLPKMSSLENYMRKSALKVARRNATKTPSKPL